MPDGQARDVERKMREFIDKREIYETLMRYCRGIDRGDIDLVLSAFHPDGVDNHTGYDAKVAERVPKAMALAKTAVNWTAHTIANHTVEVNGDVAASEAYLIAYHRIPFEGREVDWTLAARYLDRFERRNGAWKIAHRTVVHDNSTFSEVTPPPAGLMQATYLKESHQGKRAKDDLSYKLFASVRGT